MCAVLVTAMLTGCPSSANRQQVAQAVDNISIILVGFENAEVAAHDAKLIPDDDHTFIQHSMLTLGQAGKAADVCIKNSATPQGDVSCIDTVVTTVDQINATGGTYLKSAKAKSDFQIAMSSVKTVLVSIEAVLGQTSVQVAGR
jgi:hypothetical protein